MVPHIIKKNLELGLHGTPWDSMRLKIPYLSHCHALWDATTVLNRVQKISAPVQQNEFREKKTIRLRFRLGEPILKVQTGFQGGKSTKVRKFNIISFSLFVIFLNMNKKMMKETKGISLTLSTVSDFLSLDNAGGLDRNECH